MMSHQFLMAIAILNMAIALFAWMRPMAGLAWRPFALVAIALVAGLALERLAAGISAARRFRDPTPLIFPLLHLGRDVAWAAAIAMWLMRRAFGRRSSPAHSMRPRANAALRDEPSSALETTTEPVRPVTAPSE
jgi:hypothetical protein